MRHTSTAQVLDVAGKLDQPDADPNLFEWYRENGDHVLVLVEADGTVRTWINRVRQDRIVGTDKAMARQQITNLMHGDTVR